MSRDKTDPAPTVEPCCARTRAEALEAVADTYRVCRTDGERAICEGIYNRIRALKSKEGE